MKAEDAETQSENDSLRAGIIAAAVYNSAPFRKKGRAVRPTDFFRSKSDNEYMTPEEGIAAMRAFSASFRKPERN